MKHVDFRLENQKLTKRIASLEAERNALRKGVQEFLDGDYPNPRSYRPGTCQHGINYWQSCTACDIEHFGKLLKMVAEIEDPS